MSVQFPVPTSAKPPTELLDGTFQAPNHAYLNNVIRGSRRPTRNFCMKY